PEGDEVLDRLLTVAKPAPTSRPTNAREIFTERAIDTHPPSHGVTGPPARSTAGGAARARWGTRRTVHPSWSVLRAPLTAHRADAPLRPPAPIHDDALDPEVEGIVCTA